jgi:CxxC motif-containing protein (DUF1111 family)
MRVDVLLCVGAGFLLAASCGTADDPPAPPGRDAYSGGRATVFDTSRMAYAQPAPGLDRDLEEEFFVGNAIFNRSWIAAPASVTAFDGLGPVFNAINCSACHLKDGRGSPPSGPSERFSGLLLRISVAGRDAHGGPLPEPTYGGQIQGRAIASVPAEGREEVVYEEVELVLSDGERIQLRRPTYHVRDLAHGALDPHVMISPRIGNAVFGLGLLEAIPEEAILANADPEDRDRDGISGRPNRPWNVRAGRATLGRFGWKANQPTIEQQTAGAFAGDLGVTSRWFPDDDCTPKQHACKAAPSGGSPELDDALLASVVTYLRLLAVPARRRLDAPEVRRGEELFASIGCSGCHVQTFRTGKVDRLAVLSEQTIHPYTDLLLHDLGEGLEDRRPDYEASGREWRTPPLWGIGLLKTVNRHQFLLHDGRARGLVEAILWHGGEAAAARDRFAQLPKVDRDALVSFLESL